MSGKIGFDKGFIILPRSIFETAIFANEKHFKVWCWCFNKASHKERTVTIRVKNGFEDVKLERGQFIYGRDRASLETHISKSTIRNIMLLFSKTGILDSKPDSKYTIITVCNYDEIQDQKNYKGQQRGQQEDSKRTARGQQEDTDNNVKELKELKELKETVPEIENMITATLEYFNQVTGKRIDTKIDCNRKDLRARIKEKREIPLTVENLRAVINTKSRDRHFIENPKYLHPATLFIPKNFQKYLEESSNLGNQGNQGIRGLI